MRLLILLLLLPLSVISQELPDSTIASKLGVKKLIVLQKSKGNPLDTVAIFKLDGEWKDENSVDSSESRKVIISSDSNGRSVFIKDENTDRKCKSDSVGVLHRYDREGKLTHWVYYTCDSKKIYRDYYYYNGNGKLAFILSPVKDGVAGFREEYIYDESDRLVYINIWYAANPISPDRIKGDYRHSRTTYYYDKNGLIKESVLEDPENITGDNYSEENEDGDPLPNVKFTYIYIYN